ncbi:hypothetical protein N7468_005509 [Penicillium chermesinum]|uniref:Chromatin SPT2 n=1 Tax=Penicillium chermesinum TaxID=63820 RepID=A0A9W9TNG6_9EURO|nr:uncharacterized protein N7468_005509 [Penicillium chermesinum]KAJ5232553.1 hypothetical protein N7468_005509 [Penicillium chermesinum]KAJ6172210.1 hypothetical protein N7470_001277 [Penicillium chermesinum]
MSFLDSVLSSLGGSGSPAPSLTQCPAPPVTSAKKNTPPVKRDGPGLPTTFSGTKRKADEQLPGPTRPTNPASKVPAKQTLSKPAATPGATKTPANSASKRDSPKSVAQNGAPTATSSAKASAMKPAAPSSKPAASASKSGTSKNDAPPAKPPVKGSYADLMAQAKAKQEKCADLSGGVKNKRIEREKISWREHQQRLAEAKAKRAGRSFKPSTPSKPAQAIRKSSSPEISTYKGTAKPASKAPELPAYRGTAGLASTRRHNDRRVNGRRRMNEYLGTDEEDEGDYGAYDDYYSDASSDMEAGFDDVLEEDAAALRSARLEDEKEQRLEEAAKKAKLERQKKLAALASRKR